MNKLNRWIIPSLGLLALLVLAGGSIVLAQDDPQFTYAGDIAAPEFPEGLSWLNVDEPLTLEELQGKIVVLDFWTYGCINCIHVIPDLKQLEAEYPDELVVIGVHSAKFENESVTENIRQIVQRYEVVHPVVNDAEFTVWNTYGANAWPSLYVIDPLGNVVGRHAGEGVYEVLQPVIDTMAQEFGVAGLIDTTPIAFSPELDDLSPTPLLFPGAVHVDAENNRLFIADTGNNRIVITRLDNYEVQQIIGTGSEGLVDGDYTIATFNKPHGMTLVDNILYVADTNNHVIRAIDLDSGTVSTVAGTGEMAQALMQAGPATETQFRSPWDVVEQDGVLYIAMAGSHQLWEMDLAAGTVAPFAGNAREDLIDGPRLDAELAQPSGLAIDNGWVYFTDSESSSIRRADIAENGMVETIVGPVSEPQGRLFTFGDVDGTFDEVRLQHPLGVAFDENGRAYISDTYNNKIKLIDPAARTSETVIGQLQGGYFDGDADAALLDEPGGLAYHDGRLFIADTNNHAIRVLDVEANSLVSVIFPNVSVLLPQDTAAVDTAPIDYGNTLDSLLGGETLVLDVQTVGPGQGTILVDAVMPFGYKLNASAPFTAQWEQDTVVDVATDVENYQVITPDLPIEFPVNLTEGETNLSVDLTIYWCEAINETLCFVERGTVVLPVVVTDEAPGSVISLSYQLTPPDNPEDEGFNFGS